jgi:hypothetical protein
MKTKKPSAIASLSAFLLLAADVPGQQPGALSISCPPHETHGVCGVSSAAPVTYPPPTTTGGNCSTAHVISCSPPSGAMFILGTTTVTCTATKRCGERATCSFEVTLARDTTPPTIQCPSNMVFNCLCPGNAIVLDFFKPAVTDNRDPNPTLVCNPPSLVSSPGGQHRRGRRGQRPQ